MNDEVCHAIIKPSKGNKINSPENKNLIGFV